MRGYFGIGVYQPKTEMNIGTLWRSAQIFGASFIFTIGQRYKHQSSDTLKTPRHIPLFTYKSFEEFYEMLPYNSQLIGIEQDSRSVDLANFSNPQQAVYLLGAEDNGLPPKVMGRCKSVVHISTPMCLNVAVAGSIVLFHRQGVFAKPAEV